MAKNKRGKEPALGFGGIGLKPEEDDRLIKMLAEHDLKLRQLIRALVRQWVAEGGHGVLKYSKK